MNKTVHIESNTHRDHTTYGGLILPTDFNTCVSTDKTSQKSSVASRIASDYAFDSWCLNYKKHITRFRERVIKKDK
jgi:hypothetical protein